MILDVAGGDRWYRTPSLCIAQARESTGWECGAGDAGIVPHVSNRLDDQITFALEQAEELGGILPLVPAGAPVLRRRAEPYEGQVDDALLERLIAAMRDTMRDAPGVGLAAPQVGIGLQLFVAEDPITPEDAVELADERERAHFPYRAYVNAEYEDVEGARVSFYEGCLSIPGYQAVVERSRQVVLKAATPAGESIEELLTGWPARIVAHETDHLHGVLYLDRAQLRSLATDEAVAMLWNAAVPTDAARVLGFDLAPGQIL